MRGTPRARSSARTSSSAISCTRSCSACQSPTFHGDTIYAETKVLEKKPSQSKPDRGIVTVETRGFNQRGEEVCYFRRKVMVLKRDHATLRQRPYESPQ